MDSSAIDSSDRAGGPSKPHPFWDGWLWAFSSVRFSRSVVSESVIPWTAGNHTRLPCPSPNPGAYSNSCSSSWWYHPNISFSVVSFPSCLQPFPALGSFPVSQLFTSSGQSTGASASASVLPVNIQGWFPLGWTCRSQFESSSTFFCRSRIGLNGNACP